MAIGSGLALDGKRLIEDNLINGNLNFKAQAIKFQAHNMISKRKKQFF